MSKVKIEVDFEEIKKVICQLSGKEKEELFFELNPVWGEALREMEREAMGRIRKGGGVAWEKLRDEI